MGKIGVASSLSFGVLSGVSSFLLSCFVAL
jgi:hypothetical protein